MSIDSTDRFCIHSFHCEENYPHRSVRHPKLLGSVVCVCARRIHTAVGLLFLLCRSWSCVCLAPSINTTFAPLVLTPAIGGSGSAGTYAYYEHGYTNLESMHGDVTSARQLAVGGAKTGTIVCSPRRRVPHFYNQRQSRPHATCALPAFFAAVYTCACRHGLKKVND